MKAVKILVSPVGDHVVSGQVVTQRNRNGTWIVERSDTFLSGDPSSDRTFVLGDDQRIVIEGVSSKRAVQAAPVPQVQVQASRAQPQFESGGADVDEDSPPVESDRLEMSSAETFAQRMREEELARIRTLARQQIKKVQQPELKLEQSVARTVQPMMGGRLTFPEKNGAKL